MALSLTCKRIAQLPVGQKSVSLVRSCVHHTPSSNVSTIPEALPNVVRNAICATAWTPTVVMGGRFLHLRGSAGAGRTLTFHHEQIFREIAAVRQPESGQIILSATSRSPLIEAASVDGDVLTIRWSQQSNDEPDVQLAGTSPTASFNLRQIEKMDKDTVARLEPKPLIFPGVEPAGSAHLARFSYDDIVGRGSDGAHAQLPWDGTPSTDTSRERALQLLLQAVNRDGLALVRGCPTDSERSVLSIAGRIGPPLHTIYGLTWRVEATPQPVNIAYSPVGLELHQDLAYYESPPGLQLLACREFDDDVVGGESTFLDAFTAANLLRIRHPQHFITLTKLPATFQKIHYARSRPVHLEYSRPHIVVDRHADTGEDVGLGLDGSGLVPDGAGLAAEGSVLAAPITAVYWAPPFEGRLRLPPHQQQAYWDARWALADVIRDVAVGQVTAQEVSLLHALAGGGNGGTGMSVEGPETVLAGSASTSHRQGHSPEASNATADAFTGLVQFRMEPDDTVIFNNRRLLHGRREFSIDQSRPGQGRDGGTRTGGHTRTGGRRLLQGCYISSDDWANRLAHLNATVTGDGQQQATATYRHGDGNMM